MQEPLSRCSGVGSGSNRRPNLQRRCVSEKKGPAHVAADPEGFRRGCLKGAAIVQCSADYIKVNT